MVSLCCYVLRPGVYEIMEQTKKELFKSTGVDVTIAKVRSYIQMAPRLIMFVSHKVIRSPL